MNFVTTPPYGSYVRDTAHEHYSLLVTPMGALRMTRQDRWTDKKLAKGDQQ